jgi:hypothetical protein
MAERSSLTQTVQIGAESTATPGTAVVTGKQLTAMGIEMGPRITFDRFRPAGYKYATIVTPNMEFVEANLNGRPTYTEIVYPLSGLLGGATIATPSGGTASRSWTFAPSSTANDVPITYTVAVGGTAAADRAEKFSYGLVTGLTIPFDRSSISMTGTMIGQIMSIGVGTALMVGTATAISLVPVLSSQVCVYSDATSGSLGSSRLTRVMSGELSITNKYAPLWTVDCTQASFVAHVDVEPSAQLRLTVEADAAGLAHYTNAQAGTTEFVRVEATGTVIEAGTIKYKMTWDLAGKVKEVSAFKDSAGVYAYDITYDIVHDGTWTKALTCVVINNLTSLA